MSVFKRMTDRQRWARPYASCRSSTKHLLVCSVHAYVLIPITPIGRQPTINFGTSGVLPLPSGRNRPCRCLFLKRIFCCVIWSAELYGQPMRDAAVCEVKSRNARILNSKECGCVSLLHLSAAVVSIRHWIAFGAMVSLWSYYLATSIITLAGITFCVLVGKTAAHGFSCW